MCMLIFLQECLDLVWHLLLSLSWFSELFSSWELLGESLGYPSILWSLP